MRARRAKLKGTVGSRGDALALVDKPGDLALVERGKLRSIVIQCPDGCGDKLTINLDPEAGAAWRLYSDLGGRTLYPSVWRTTGCESHFILWSNRIYWMDRRDPKPSQTRLVSIRSSVLGRLVSTEWTSVVQLADVLDESPWLLARVCQRLALDGVLEKSDQDRDCFRLPPRSE